MSLTTRLSAFFLGMLALVLVGFSLSLYLLARGYLYRQTDQRLAAALETLAATAEAEPEGLEWEPNQRHLTLGRDAGADQVRWEVRDGKDNVIDRSRNLGGEASLDPESSSVEAHSAHRAGRPWRLAQRWLQAAEAPTPSGAVTPASAAVGPGPPPPRYPALLFTVGVALEPVHGALQSLAVSLTSLSLVLWLTAAVLGRWLCRRALAPVTRMAEAARAMGAADREQRLPEPGTGDELAELHRAFNGLLDRLQEAFERQSQFTGNASHQLRTPLTAMLGQVEVALRRDRSRDEYRRALTLVQDQAGGLRQIVEALLFLSRADAEAELAGLQETKLATWLPQHLVGWAGHARAADVQMEETTDSRCMVWIQPLLLGQLLDNLLDNALKYSQPGNPFTVSVRHEPEAIIVNVKDEGDGLAPEELPHVFEPFYRSPAARRRGKAGVGLGLAVAQRIARAFSGTLSVVSNLGRGSCFSLRLPAPARDGAPQGIS